MTGMLAAAFLEGFGLGAGLIVAIGAQNAYVLRQGLKGEHVFAVAGLCFLVDVALIALGAGGFASLISKFAGATDAIAWISAAFLFLYGLRAFHGALKPGTLDARDARNAGGSLRAAALTALALSLLNPHVYLDTVVLIGGLAAQYPPSPRAAFALGAMAASLVWFYALGYGAGRLAPVFAKPRAWRLLDIAIGCVMWTIAAGLLWERV
jgi:L-lysine exporter family protein LysE/ArgO